MLDQAQEKNHEPSELGAKPIADRTPASWWSLMAIWLLGTVCVSFSQGHYPSPVLAIIGIACWIWFFRRAGFWIAFFSVILAYVISWEIAYRGMVPLPTAARIGMEFGVSILVALVFTVDRFATARYSHRFPALLLSLVFPCGWVAFDLLSARVSPGATWGSIAYSFVGHGPIVDIAALVGWTGLTYLVGWVAVIICNTLEPAIAWRQKTPMIVVGSAIVIVFSISGVARQQFGNVDLQVSLIVAPDTYHTDKNLNEVWAYTRGIKQNEREKTLAVEQIRKSKQQHLEIIRAEAEAGSKLILSAEANASVSAAEEVEWINAAAEISEEFQAYVGLGLMVFHPAEQQPSENKFVLVGPDGSLVADFLKRTRPPGVSHVIGTGPLPMIETEYGSWTAAICYDMDFPQIINRTAGQVDLILAPSNDWTEAAHTHMRMAHMRAIENGCCLIRPTKDGISSITNSCGRPVATQLTDGASNSVLRSHVKLGRSWALYPLIGDAFAWICSLFWILAIASLFLNSSKE